MSIRMLCIALLAATVAGCGERPPATALIPVATEASSQKEVTIFAISDRAAGDAAGLTYTGRPGVLSYEEYHIRLNLPADQPSTSIAATHLNPAKDLQTVGRRKYDRASFLSALHQPGQQRATPFLFVHGFNKSYPEALFNLAQMTAEGSDDLVPILFTWPSEASLTGYLADRDGAHYARDHLVEVLTMLAANQPSGDIAVLGHSMGAWLLLEAVRQLRLEGRDDVISRLNIGLAAPDVDIDVFQAQMRVIGPLKPPMTVLVSTGDRALLASQRVAGGRLRLGMVNVNDPQVQLLSERTGVRFVDITNLPATTPLNHDRFVSMAALYGNAPNRSPLAGPLSAGAYILDASGKLLASPFSVGAQILSGGIE